MTLDSVIDTTGNALWVSPLTFLEASTPGTGGFVDTANQRFGVQHILPITTPDQLASVTLHNVDGRTMRLGDVADVVQDHQPLIGDAVLDDSPALMLVVQKFPKADTGQVTRDLEDAMASLAPGLGGITIDTKVFRPQSFIDQALHNIGAGAVVAVVLLLALLTLALFSWRVAVISVVATIVSLSAALTVLGIRGATFNTMVLAGLAVALVVVIDDVVVSTSSIARRLRLQRETGDDRSATTVVAEAALEDRGPLLYATCVILLAAVPVFLLTDVAGSFGRPLVVSYALAVLASVVVALTVTPALALMLLSGRAAASGPSPAVRWVERQTQRLLQRFVATTWVAYAALAVLVIGALAVLPQLDGGALIPAPQQRQLVVPFQAAPGASVPAMDEIAAAATKEVRAVPGVTEVGVHVGRAIMSDQIVPTTSGELWVTIDDDAPYDATVAAIRRRLNKHPEFDHQLATYATERLQAAGTGTTHPVVVRVYGPELPKLRASAEKVRQAISSVDGVVNARVQRLSTEPTLQIKVDLAAAQRIGIKPGDVRRETATLLAGLLVGNLYEQQKIFDVVVWGDPTVRSDVAGVQNLLIDTPDGGHIRLGDVASVQLRPYPTSIRHDDVSRSLAVIADVSGRGVDGVVGDVRDQVAALGFPLEYHAEVFDDYSDARRADLRLLGIAVVAALGIFLLLQAATGSWRAALLLLLTLPLATVGGVLSAGLAGGLMSAGALAGLLAVLAIATRHNIVLVRRYQQLRTDGKPLGPAAAVRAAEERSSPVLLTVLATAVTVLPFVVVGTVAGEEVVHPLAVVLLGGLLSSALLTLLVLPVLCVRFVPPDQPDPSEPPAPGDDRTIRIPESRGRESQEAGHVPTS